MQQSTQNSINILQSIIDELATINSFDRIANRVSVYNSVKGLLTSYPLSPFGTDERIASEHIKICLCLCNLLDLKKHNLNEVLTLIAEQSILALSQLVD